MELMQQAKGYSDSREEEEDEEAAADIITITREEESTRLHYQDEASNNFINQRKQLDFMDLSLGSNKKVDEANFQQRSEGLVGASSSSNNNEAVEKEHMFDKVVTPSDVGKLNRLVIPKQHAEKYFPLDASSNEKGLLLNFEDRNGKLWRFRYSYWNSSQSYVMTKGWSRFVKEKKLDAGDIVSFQRGLGDLYRHRLYIDWRRRPDHVHGVTHDPSTTLISPLFLPNHYSIRWGSRLYSLPSPPAATSTMPQHLNYNHMYTFHHQQQQYYGSGGSGSGSGSHHIHNNNYSEMNLGSESSVYYLRSTSSMSMHQMGNQNLPQQERGNIPPMIIDSVPVAHHYHHHHHHGVTSSSSSNSNAGKRLRLFGVNMECASSPVEDSKCLSSSASAAHVTTANSLPSSSLPSQRGGTTSVLFDLDPSLQYR